MKFKDLIDYQKNFCLVLDRAKSDSNFYCQVWNDPVKTLMREGINELDIVDFLRQIQIGNLALDAGWGQICYPIEDLTDTPI